MSDNFRSPTITTRRRTAYNNNSYEHPPGLKSKRQWILILITTFLLILFTVVLFSWTLYIFSSGATPGSSLLPSPSLSPSDSLQSTRSSSLPSPKPNPTFTSTSTAAAGPASNSDTKPTLPHSSSSSPGPSTTHPHVQAAAATETNNVSIIAYVTPYKLPPDPELVVTGLDPSTPTPDWFEPAHFYPNRFTSSTSASPNSSSKASHPSDSHVHHDSGQFRPFYASVWDPHPQYKFNAFGDTWHLTLRSGGAGSAGAANIIPIIIHHEGNTTRRDLVGLDTGCFYTGTVIGDESSLVSVSLCQGMTGHIRTRTGSYFIEPLLLVTGQQDGQTQTSILHKLYLLGGDNISGNSSASASTSTSTSSDSDGKNPSSPRFHDDDFLHGSTITTNNNDDAHLISQRRNIASLSGDDINHHHQLTGLGEDVEINYSRSSSSKSRGRRVKRSMSRERYIELMVVTDSTMSAYHGDNLKHYVLTLLSIVALIYSDASIGNPMNVALVKFHILKDVDFIWKQKQGSAGAKHPYQQSSQYNHYNSVEANGHQHHSSSAAASASNNYGISASEMLRNFCKWQKEHNHADDSSPLHHDTALLLTRETICRNPWLQKCDTLGLAELGTMCDSYASCAIVQDNGLSAAFTIAHELGHVMNMPHDDDVKCLGFLGNTAETAAAYRMDTGAGAGAGTGTGTAPTLNIFAATSSSSSSTSASSSSAPSHSQDTSSSAPASVSLRSVTAHYVMSRMLDHNTYPWAWSKCSRHYLTEFLDAGHGLCLEDRPPSNLLQAVQEQNQRRQPGEIFSKDRQCELVFGPHSQLCSYMPVCRRLWCTSDEIDGCRTQHMPWADGTPCTPSGHKWCQRGACVLKDLEQLRVVDGDWGQWKPFGPCSRSCSGGVRRSTRECDNPPPSNGGKYCIGPRIRYESCSTHECPGEHKDFRAEQCAKFNNDNFNIQGLPRNVTWVPKYTGIITKDRCKLFCRVAGSSAYYLLREKVIDGTPCAPDTFDICVNGACLPAGCDRKLHSTKVLDACGVCNGDSSTCKTQSGSYNDTRYGYNTVVRIPAGASNLDVRQRGANDSARDDNYLAIVDPVTNEYLLNGHFVVSMFRKTIHAMGSTLEYSGSDSATERINSTLPLKSDLIVQVLSVGKLWQPDIRYQYIISAEVGGVARGVVDQASISYNWVLSDSEYTECSRICQGTKSRTYVCVRRVRSTPSSQVQVESAYCSGDPPQTRTYVDCNSDCTLKWSCAMSGSGDCSPEAMTCVKFLSTQNLSIAVPPEHCLAVGLRRECDDCQVTVAPPPPEWTECSRVCGEGVQTCKHNCEGLSQQVRRCNKGQCGQWRISEWSPCSTTCGSHGIHRAIYACHHVDGSLLSHEYCADTPKPAVERKCENPPCSLQWIVGEWSQCSGVCGLGRMQRKVQCVLEAGTVSDRYCDQLLKPLSESECRHREECTTTSNARNYEIDNEVGPFDGSGRNTAVVDWIAEAWLECESETNYRVYRRRKVYCASGEVQCAAVKRPAAIEECEGAWWVSDWSTCNTTCGEGIETRSVRCPTGQSCLESTRPTHTRRSCINNSKCKYRRGFTDGWNVGAWGKCSKLCGGGVKLRQVVCVTPTVAGHCQDKPLEMMTCNLEPCPVWYTGPWSQCTAECGGGGHQERTVQCRDTNDVLQPDDHCAHFTMKPNATRECGTKECIPVQQKNLHGSWVTRWTVGAWSNCTKTCGKGIKRRLVQCTRFDRSRPSSTLSIVNDTECSAGHTGRHQHTHGNNVAGKKKAKPREQRGCARFPCPFKWVTSEWSECSTTCGYGLQQRMVGCHRVNKYGWIDPDPVPSGCESLGPAPQTYRYCRFSVDCLPSTLYRWVVSEWSECPPATSAKCGREYKQKRKVYCALNKTGSRVGGSFCDKEHKPARRRVCPIKSCKQSSCADKHRDGEYMMWVGGTNISIFCSSAHHLSDNSVHHHPIRRREYLSLPEEDNYSEFYGKRLVRPDTCPANGQRLDSCECVEDVNHRIGYTKWEKVRIDIDRLIVDVDDMTFARQISGSPIPFGSSGDCYSNMNCPQGRFSINLQGTGLQVDPMTTWISQGHKAAMWINKSEDNVRITGKCGGYCGNCAPNRLPGLKLQPA